MTGGIRIIRHEAESAVTSRFAFACGHFEDLASRRPDMLTSEQAQEKARALARAERDKGT